MQPDFFKMDISRDSGELSAAESRKKDRSSRGGDRRSKDQAVKLPFAEALQEAAGSTGGVTENAPRRPVTFERNVSRKNAGAEAFRGAHRKQTPETDPETALAQAACPLSAVLARRHVPLASRMMPTDLNGSTDGDAAAGRSAERVSTEAGRRNGGARRLSGSVNGRRTLRGDRTPMPVGVAGKPHAGARVFESANSDKRRSVSEGRKGTDPAVALKNQDGAPAASDGRHGISRVGERKDQFDAPSDRTGRISETVVGEDRHAARAAGKVRVRARLAGKDQHAGRQARSEHTAAGATDADRSRTLAAPDGRSGIHSDREGRPVTQAANVGRSAARRHRGDDHNASIAADKGRNGEHGRREGLGAAQPVRSGGLNAVRSTHNDSDTPKPERGSRRAAGSARPTTAPATDADTPRLTPLSTVAGAPTAPAADRGRGHEISSRLSRGPRPNGTRVTRRHGQANSAAAVREAGLSPLGIGSRFMGPVRAPAGAAVHLTTASSAPADATLRSKSAKTAAGTDKKTTEAQGRARQSVSGGAHPQTVATIAADGDTTLTNRDAAAAAGDRTAAHFGGARAESAAHHATSPAETGAQRAVPAEVLQQLAGKAAFMVRNGQESLRIQLNPGSLGHIHLKVSTEDRQVMIRMLVDNPATKDLIEHNMGQLRIDLAHQGLTIDRLDLDLFSNNAASGQSGDPAANDGSSRFSGRRQSGKQTTKDTTGEDPQTVAWDLDSNSTLVGVFA